MPKPPWKRPDPPPRSPNQPLSFTCTVCGRVFKSLRAAINCNHKD
jgi:hypothetical protein